MKFTKKELKLFEMYPCQRYISIDKSIPIKKLDDMLRKQFKIPEGYRLEHAGNGTFDTTVRLHWYKYKRGRPKK